MEKKKFLKPLEFLPFNKVLTFDEGYRNEKSNRLTTTISLSSKHGLNVQNGW
jgi:hypothetical protein